DPDSAFAALPKAADGFSPVARARLDFRPVGPIIEQQLEAAGAEEGEKAADALRKLGIVGPDANRYTWQLGYTKDECVSYTVAEGLKPHAKEMGILTAPLDESTFAMIPSDATVAAITRVDLKQALSGLKEAVTSTPQGREGLEKFKGTTGVD